MVEQTDELPGYGSVIEMSIRRVQIIDSDGVDYLTKASVNGNVARAKRRGGTVDFGCDGNQRSDDDDNLRREETKVARARADSSSMPHKIAQKAINVPSPSVHLDWATSGKK